MYVIVVYDIGEKKVNKIHKYLKKRLYWIQNSVFEGELSNSEFIKLKKELTKMLKEWKKGENSIIIFSSINKKIINKEVIGIDKNKIDDFI